MGLGHVEKRGTVRPYQLYAGASWVSVENIEGADPV
jgi:hypothetical protein